MTQSPWLTSARCAAMSTFRFSGSPASCDAAAVTAGVRIASVTSSPSASTRPPSKRMSVCSLPLRAAARYIAPESRYSQPSASATARATVDFPAPAGPSMAMRMRLPR